MVDDDRTSPVGITTGPDQHVKPGPVSEPIPFIDSVHCHYITYTPTYYIALIPDSYVHSCIMHTASCVLAAEHKILQKANYIMWYKMMMLDMESLLRLYCGRLKMLFLLLLITLVVFKLPHVWPCS